MTQGYLGVGGLRWVWSKENPFIIPGVCGVGEINKGVHAGFIYILLREPNTLTWGKGRWVGGLRGRGEGVSEAGTGGGGKEVGDGEVKRVIYSQKFVCFFFRGTHTGWRNRRDFGGGVERFLDLNAGGIQIWWLQKKTPTHRRAVNRGEPRKQKKNPKNSPKSGGYKWRRQCMFHTGA